jgi:hypothetical protein
MKKNIFWIVPALMALAPGGCAFNNLPPANTVQARFNPKDRVVQVTVSQPERTTKAELVGADGALVQVGRVGLVSVPHVFYNIASGCGFGTPYATAALPPSGLPPSCVAEESDQYVMSVSIPAPADYAQRWTEYRVRLQVGNRWLTVAAPSPTPGSAGT